MMLILSHQCMYVCSLLSLALFAKEHNCVRPELTDDSVIYIKAGRWADSIALVIVFAADSELFLSYSLNIYAKDAFIT